MPRPGTSRRFACSYDGCRRAFPKAEHLARHERTHSGAQPYKCPTCDRAFSRHDSMIRHTKLHTATSRAISTTTADHATSSRDLPGDALVSPVTAATSHTSFNLQGDSLTSQNASTARSAPDSTQNHLYNYAPTPVVSEFDPSIANYDASTSLDWHLSFEEILNMIQTDPTQHPTPIALNMFPESQAYFTGDLTGRRSAPTQNSTSSDAGRHAVKSTSQIIKDLPTRLIAEFEENETIPSFFDECLDMFFNTFSPMFPIIHRPTFNPRECGSTVLINILALGSAFSSHKDALLRGEALWTLAHTVVATTWQSMLSHQTLDENCRGTQLVLTATLGQTYAFLSSNFRLRVTSHLFHGIGFYWSREGGIYTSIVQDTCGIPPLDANSMVKDRAWKSWASREMRIRTLLSYYILDGQISSFSGNPTSTRHATNPLPFPSSSGAFEADNADTWIVELSSSSSQNLSVREYILALFHSEEIVASFTLPELGLRTVLECIQSMVLEEAEARGSAIGAPSKADIALALLRLRRLQIVHAPNATDIMLRWHSVLLSMCVDIRSLAEQLCSMCSVPMNLFTPREDYSAANNLQAFTSSIEGRRALLHAISIQDSLNHLSLGRSHAIHIPFAIFAAGVIFASFIVCGIPVIVTPRVIDWESIWRLDQISSAHSMLPGNPGKLETILFLHGSLGQGDPRAAVRGLLPELNTLRTQLKASSGVWGISGIMENIIDGWTHRIRSKQ